MSWHIQAWSREKGRGTIIGSQADPLDFDASIALVDDFRIGEEVHIEIERYLDTWRVTRIWPDDPRFSPRSGASSKAPELKDFLAQKGARELAKVQYQHVYRVTSLRRHALIVQGDERIAYPPPQDELTFVSPSYFELIREFGLKSIRLSLPLERDYLADRLQSGLTPDDIGITLVDDRNQFYFVVCADLRYRQIPPRT